DSIISLTTFLSMYMLVYSEILPDKLRYHNRIIELIPRIPSIPIPELTSGNSKKEYSAILNLSTPRLLSSYMNNFNDYIYDINSIALSKFNSKINSVDGVAFSDHIRQDSSAFAVHSERHVPYVNYSIYLKKVVEEMKFPDLYASVYSVLDIPGNFYDSVKRIVTTIMHPTIKVLQHGLNSSKGDITSEFNWLDVKGKIGCYLIPSIGFGIFKTNQFMFSLRIPMHNIPLSVLSVCNSAELRQCNKFVTSILNLRKIYKTGETYSDYKTWNDICKETGLLIYGGFPMNTFDEYVYSNIGHKTFRTNYVGQLEKNDQVLFWKRSNEAICRSEKEGTTYTVTEVGMFTTEGLEAIYEFSTNRSAGTLKFNYKNDAQSKCLVNNLKNCNQRNDVIEIRLNKDHIASFKWFMPTNHTQKSHDLQFSNGTQTFTYNYHNYKIENMDFDETSFTVKCNNKVILIGNNSPRLKEIIRYDGTDYHRDPETMMYQKN
ncbi:GSCOCG00003953001-RA-CDS, partial [Cotesia congregata]